MSGPKKCLITANNSTCLTHQGVFNELYIQLISSFLITALGINFATQVGSLQIKLRDNMKGTSFEEEQAPGRDCKPPFTIICTVFHSSFFYHVRVFKGSWMSLLYQSVLEISVMKSNLYTPTSGADVETMLTRCPVSCPSGTWEHPEDTQTQAVCQLRL